ncbi:MAG: hypothetical protein HWN81_21095 [Candidatus Lokiarchaeota archaeon]|nr:hypothetical protein [Candidatus Lokiarchaeota archaeon]
MRRRKLSKIALKSLLFSFILILILSTNVSALIKKDMAWKDVENKDKAFVYTLKMYTYAESDLEYNEFILDDKIHTLYFEIFNYPLNVSSIDFTLRIISPSENEVYMKDFSFTRSSWHKGTLDLKLNETGLWYWNLYINLHKDDSIDSLDLISLIQYNYESQEFNKDSIVEVLYGLPSDTIRLTGAAEFPDGFRVYTQSEAAQIISARALEKAAKYQQQTAESSEENIGLQQNMVYVLLLTAGITLIGIIISSIFSYKQHQELNRERKRSAIIKMIVEAVDKSIEEFQTLNLKLKKIQDKIDLKNVKNISFPPPPSIIYRKHLASSSWKDFENEYPDIYSKIQDYLNKKDRYLLVGNSCLQSIVKSIKKVKINKQMDLLIEELRKASRTEGTNQEYLHKDLSMHLAKCILSLGSVDNQASILFQKFKDKWLDIRKEDPIRQQIEKLASCLKELTNYLEYCEKMKTIRWNIMKEYNILDGTLDKYKFEKHKEQLDYSLKSQQNGNNINF